MKQGPGGKAEEAECLFASPCRGLDSTLDEAGGTACWDGSWNPCSSVAGLINSCTHSLIQALLHGSGRSLIMCVLSLYVGTASAVLLGLESLLAWSCDVEKPAQPFVFFF